MLFVYVFKLKKFDNNNSKVQNQKKNLANFFERIKGWCTEYRNSLLVIFFFFSVVTIYQFLQFLIKKKIFPFLISDDASVWEDLSFLFVYFIIMLLPLFVLMLINFKYRLKLINDLIYIYSIFSFSIVLVLLLKGYFRGVLVQKIFEEPPVMQSINEFFYVERGIQIGLVCLIVFVLFPFFVGLFRNFFEKVEVLVLYIMLLFFIVILISVNNLFTIFLILETISFIIIILIAITSGPRINVEATIKYFIFNGISSSFYCFGIGVLYALMGDFNLVGNALHNLIVDFTFPAFSAEKTDFFFFKMGVFFIFFGLLCKIGTAPFSFWIVDVYEQVSVFVLMVLLTLIKVSYLVVLFKFLVSFMIAIVAYLLVFFALLSLFLGAVFAVKQNRFKRFIGFVTLNQTGYLLLGFLEYYAYEFYDDNSSFGTLTTGLWSYLLVYVLSNVLLLFCLLGVHFFNEKQVVYTTDVYFISNPVVKWVLCVVSFSFIGVPPLPGFYTKFLVIYNIIESGLVGVGFFALAVSVLQAFYYLVFIKTMFFKEKPVLKEVRDSMQTFNDKRYRLFNYFLLVLFFSFVVLGLVGTFSMFNGLTTL